MVSLVAFVLRTAPVLLNNCIVGRFNSVGYVFQENFSIQFKMALQRRVQLIKDFVEFYGLFTLPNTKIETDTDKMCTKPNGTLLGLILSAVRTLPHNSISVSVFIMESGSVNTPFRGWSIYCHVWSINSTVKRICNKK